MSQIRYNDENHTTDWIEQVLGCLIAHSKQQNGVKCHSTPMTPPFYLNVRHSFANKNYVDCDSCVSTELINDS